MADRTFLALLSLILLLPGCATFDGLRTRRDANEAFLFQMEARTASALDPEMPLDLERCVAIALEHNHDIRTAELESRIAGLSRQVAFAKFLPEVTLDLNHVELDNAPATSLFAGLTMPVQDRIVRDTAIQAQMPIFAPATWFLYAMHQRGEEIGDIAAEYTRRMITLQVTGHFFQCLATRESGRVLETQRNAAATLAHEVGAYHDEGLVTDGDLAQVRVLALARDTAVDLNARAFERDQAELLTAMGLPPTTAIQLGEWKPLVPPEGELEDWLLSALLHHPRLAMADRQAAIEREKMRLAITDFLPVLAGFASRSHSSNSYLAFPYVSAAGFAGVMTLFNGFANINEYQIAKARHEQASLAVEQASLAVMLEVVRARAAYEDAQAHLTLADAAAEASAITLQEKSAMMREGLLRPSEMLDIVAGHDEAQVNVLSARYQEQVMVAFARNAVGAVPREYKENKDE